MKTTATTIRPAAPIAWAGFAATSMASAASGHAAPALVPTQPAVVDGTDLRYTLTAPPPRAGRSV